MKIVKFENGKYGIRKGWFPYSYQYLDLVTTKNNEFWWGTESVFFETDCQGTKERVMAVCKRKYVQQHKKIKSRKDKGKQLNEIELKLFFDENDPEAGVDLWKD
jgi:hypothetical protein